MTLIVGPGRRDRPERAQEQAVIIKQQIYSKRGNDENECTLVAGLVGRGDDGEATHRALAVDEGPLADEVREALLLLVLHPDASSGSHANGSLHDLVECLLPVGSAPRDELAAHHLRASAITALALKSVGAQWQSGEGNVPAAVQIGRAHV